MIEVLLLTIHIAEGKGWREEDAVMSTRGFGAHFTKMAIYLGCCWVECSETQPMPSFQVLNDLPQTLEQQRYLHKQKFLGV